jgi:hypothetical protein
MSNLCNGATLQMELIWSAVVANLRPIAQSASPQKTDGLPHRERDSHS